MKRSFFNSFIVYSKELTNFCFMILKNNIQELIKFSFHIEKYKRNSVPNAVPSSPEKIRSEYIERKNIISNKLSEPHAPAPAPAPAPDLPVFVKDDECREFLKFVKLYKLNEGIIGNYNESQVRRNKLISENKKLANEITARFFNLPELANRQAYTLLKKNDGLLKEVNTLLKQKYDNLYVSISWYKDKSDENNKSILNVSLFGDEVKRRKAHQKTTEAQNLLTEDGNINNDSDCMAYKRVIKKTLSWRNETDNNNTENNIKLIAQDKSPKFFQGIKKFLTFTPIVLPGALFFMWDAHKNKGGICNVVSTEGKRVEASMEKVAKDLTPKMSLKK